MENSVPGAAILPPLQQIVMVTAPYLNAANWLLCGNGTANREEYRPCIERPRSLSESSTTSCLAAHSESFSSAAALKWILTRRPDVRPPPAGGKTNSVSATTAAPPLAPSRPEQPTKRHRSRSYSAGAILLEDSRALVKMQYAQFRCDRLQFQCEWCKTRITPGLTTI